MTTAEPSNRATHVGPTRPERLDDWTIELGGLVAHPQRLKLHALAQLPLVPLAPTIECPEGGIGTAGNVYEGIALADLVALAGPTDGARYVYVHSGPFVASFALDSLDRRQSIVAIHKNGQPIDWPEGGPVRLVANKGACFDTVKWVERITLEADSSGATAVSIVRARREETPEQ